MNQIPITPNYFFKSYWCKENTDRSIEKRLRRFNRRKQNGKYNNKDKELSAKNSLYRMQLRNKVTEAEKIFGDYLWNNKVYFTFQKGFFTPFHRIADFYIPALKLIIEIDGGYHINTIDKDFTKDYLWLKKRHISTLRIKNEQIIDSSFKEINIIKNILNIYNT